VAQLREALRVRARDRAAAELARDRAADLAASYAVRLRSLAAAAAAPESTATCPVCPRETSAPLGAAAPAPVAAAGLRVGAAEFVPRARHVAGTKHTEAAAAFGSYQDAYLTCAGPALLSADRWSDGLISDKAAEQDAMVDAARTQLNALLDDVEQRRAWAGAQHAVRELAERLSAACVAANAALSEQQARERAAERAEEAEVEWEDVVVKRKGGKGGRAKGRKK